MRRLQKNHKSIFARTSCSSSGRVPPRTISKGGYQEPLMVPAERWAEDPLNVYLEPFFWECIWFTFGLLSVYRVLPKVSLKTTSTSYYDTDLIENYYKIWFFSYLYVNYMHRGTFRGSTHIFGKKFICRLMFLKFEHLMHILLIFGFRVFYDFFF